MRLLASESDVPEAAIGSHDSVAATCFETSIEVLCIEGWSSANCHAALLCHDICSPEHPEYRSLSTKKIWKFPIWYPSTSVVGGFPCPDPNGRDAETSPIRQRITRGYEPFVHVPFPADQKRITMPRVVVATQTKVPSHATNARNRPGGRGDNQQHPTGRGTIIRNRPGFRFEQLRAESY